MPWQCSTCGGEIVRDDEICPTCTAPKSSWTMAPDKTRQFVIGGKKFEVLRGASDASAPAGADPGELSPATVAPVMTKADAARVAARGHLPPSRRLLFVRLIPKAHRDLTVKLVVEHETLEAAEVALPFAGEPAPREDGSVDVRVLLVRGEGDLPAFEGVHVVEVGEPSERGFAPTIEVAALGKPFKRLPTEDDEGDELELVVAPLGVRPFARDDGPPGSAADIDDIDLIIQPLGSVA